MAAAVDAITRLNSCNSHEALPDLGKCRHHGDVDPRCLQDRGLAAAQPVGTAGCALLCWSYDSTVSTWMPGAAAPKFRGRPLHPLPGVWMLPLSAMGLPKTQL